MITILESNDLELSSPSIKRLTDNIANQIGLSLDKVVLNHFYPDKFPIGADNSYETVLKKAFSKLPLDKQRSAKIRTRARIKSRKKSTIRRDKYLSKINLRQPSTVLDQISSLKLPSVVKIDPVELEQEVAITFQKKNTTYNKARLLRPQFSVELLTGIKQEALRDKLKLISKIKKKYTEMGSEDGVLGLQKEWHGWWSEYMHGAIFWNGEKAVEVHGLIWRKYHAIGGADSYLGLPQTDELETPDTIGRYNHFQRGSIYWTRETGAHTIDGMIREKWKNLGWERSLLGYPVTDGNRTPDGNGAYNHFQHGSIYWSWTTGAHEVHGEIKKTWKALGWERSSLGYPITDEETMPDGVGKVSHFQGGEIRWYPETGAYLAASDISNLTLRCLALNCVDETGSRYEEPFGHDEMAMGGLVFEISSDGENAHKFGLVSLENGWDDGESNNWTSPRPLITVPISQDNYWPKAFIATCILVEVDSGDYSAVLDDLMVKLRPYIKQKLDETIAASGLVIGGVIGGGIGAGIGVTIGFVAGKIAAYLAGKIISLISNAWHDDPFSPVTLMLELPGPDALFPLGTYTSTFDYEFTVSGHDGRYRFNLDWLLS